jgi:hypothetical protein
MIRNIADYLRGLHKSSRWCGSLLERVFVRIPEMTAIFYFEPFVAPDNYTLRNGIVEDTLNFRRLVAFLIRSSPEISDHNRIFHPLPLDFQFFFSETFLIGLQSLDFSTVLEHSFYQLYHPATFKSTDRASFLQLIINYKNKDHIT